MKITAAAFILATAATLCFPQILNGEENSLTFTNSIFAVLLWGLCFCMLRRSLEIIDLYDRRSWRISGIFALLFTAAMLFGVRLDRTENVDFKDLKIWISLPVLAVFFMILVRRAWDLLDKGLQRRAKRMFADQIKWP